MRLQRHWRRDNRDAELSQEISFFIETATEDNIGRGMSAEEARSAACRKFGNRTLIREEVYKMSTIRALDTLRRDLRYGLPTLRLNPMFTVVALLTLGIGIGANTAVCSVVNGVLLKPLAYPKADELVALRQAAPGAAGIASVSDGLMLSPSMYFTYAEPNRTVQTMGVWALFTASVTGLAEPERVRTVFVSDGALQTLNVRPLLGRWLSPVDQKPGAPETVMLSYGYWQRRFGGERSVIGRGIRVESRPREIVGVMPEGFQFVDADPELIVPVAFDRSQVRLPGFAFRGIARLKPGVTIADANADLARMVPIWMRSWPAFPTVDPRIYESWKIGPDIRPLKQEVVGNVGNVLWVLMGTIGVVMLIVCANVANLLLVRAEGRQQELAIRAAIGAGWGRIVRELLLESVLLGLMGGVLGLGLACGGLRFLVALGPANLPRLNEIAIDPRVLGFALIVSLFSGVLFGSIPALKYAGPRISNALRGGGRTASQSRERHRARSILVVVQVALALVLLVSAGLMIRTFQALRTVEPGFTHAQQLQIARISIPESLVAEPDRVARMQNNILDKLAAIPGVASAAFATEMPMEGIPNNWDAIRAETKTYYEIPPLRNFKSISPGLFQTVGTRLIAGRDFTWTDLYAHRRFVMVSENLARELWGSPSAALGKRVQTIPSAPWHEVTGVVQDVREKGVDEPAPAIVYWPSVVEGDYRAGGVDVARNVTFVIRSSRAGSESFLNEVREAVWSVNSSLPVASVRTMQEAYNQSMARKSFTLAMLGIAGAMAMVLGIIGIYVVISYAVSQRRREIGIRLALGVQREQLTRMFVRYGVVLAGIGVAIGLAAAVGLSRLMSSLLFGISPLDPVIYAAVPIVLVTAAVLASYLPARGASAVDPLEALRAQ